MTNEKRRNNGGKPEKAKRKPGRKTQTRKEEKAILKKKVDETAGDSPPVANLITGARDCGYSKEKEGQGGGGEGGGQKRIHTGVSRVGIGSNLPRGRRRRTGGSSSPAVVFPTESDRRRRISLHTIGLAHTRYLGEW